MPLSMRWRASRGGGKTVWVWESESGRLVRVLAEHIGTILALASQRVCQRTCNTNAHLGLTVVSI